MSSDFNADEIFAVAEQIEINGRKFYIQAVRQITDEAARNMLLELAAMEGKHLKTFQALRAKLTCDQRRTVTFDPDGDAALYLKALSDSRIFDVADPACQISKDEDFKHILTRAVGMEKDSVTFYVGMMELVPPELGKASIAEIIKEEMRHVTILSEYLEHT